MQAQKQAPARQQVVETISIDAAADAVWAKIRDFDGLKDWHPAVAESPADKGSRVGSVRTLALHGGGRLVETLDSHSDTQRSYGYIARDGGALPVTGYASTIQVSGDGLRSVVEWQGSFVPKDAASGAAVAAVYQSGLESLKKLVEAR